MRDGWKNPFQSCTRHSYFTRGNTVHRWVGRYFVESNCQYLSCFTIITDAHWHHFVVFQMRPIRHDHWKQGLIRHSSSRLIRCFFRSQNRRPKYNNIHGKNILTVFRTNFVPIRFFCIFRHAACEYASNMKQKSQHQSDRGLIEWDTFFRRHLTQSLRNRRRLAMKWRTEVILIW